MKYPRFRILLKTNSAAILAVSLDLQMILERNPKTAYFTKWTRTRTRTLRKGGPWTFRETAP